MRVSEAHSIVGAKSEKGKWANKMAIGTVRQLKVVLFCKECGERYEYDPISSIQIEGCRNVNCSHPGEFPFFVKPLAEYQYVESLRQKIREMTAIVGEIDKRLPGFPFEIWMGLPDAEKTPVPRRERGNG
jgi:hypothetical protein